MFAQWWGDVLVQSAIFVQRLVTWDSEAFQSPTTAQTQTLAATASGQPRTMENKIDIEEMLRREWRELGVYYETDNNTREWKLYGDRKGIENFGTVISEYCDKRENFQISEHIHLGPYSYLKIMTWDRPIITTDFIAGTIDDLKKLSGLIKEKLRKTKIGDSFSIDKEFGDENKAKITITVMANNFDPVTLDEQLRL
jgi:hypothetical protein